MACLVTVLFVVWKTFHKNLLGVYYISAFLFITICFDQQLELYMLTYTVTVTNYENPNCNCFYRQKIKLSYHVISKTLDSSAGSLHLYFGMQSLTFQLATLSCLYTRSGHSHDLTSIRLAFRTQGLHSPSTGVTFGTHYIVNRSAFASALTRGFPIYLGKVKVTTNFSIESSPRQSTQPNPTSFISVSENVIFHLQRQLLERK